MTFGPGKYDDLCTYVREQAKAGGAIVIVFGGDKGAGFSVQSTDYVTLLSLPAFLERIADEIRRDLASGYKGEGTQT